MSQVIRRFPVPGGITIAADEHGDPGAQTLVFLPGGGQTRQSWRGGVHAMAARGYHVVSLDLRGHGESDWDPAGDYEFAAHLSDLRAILAQLPPEPILIGASLGGLVAATAVGEAATPVARGLIMVDITPFTEQAGFERIIGFMQAHRAGFGSLDEVADALAAYNPNRPPPGDPQNLRRILREEGGRFFWHWDPRIQHDSPNDRHHRREARVQQAAADIRIPLLIVRGQLSDVVSEESVRRFRELVPHAEYVNVGDAGHMVAGDRNDAFNQAIAGFLARTGLQP